MPPPRSRERFCVKPLRVAVGQTAYTVIYFFRRFAGFLAALCFLCASDRAGAQDIPVPIPVPSPVPVPQGGADIPPEPTPKVGQPDNEPLSTSPVPITSILYPGSTVRTFRGKDNFGFRLEGDLRYRSVTGQGERSGTYVSAGRLTGDWVRANPNNRDERGGVRVQLLLETDTRGTGIESVRLSEAYGYYTFLSGGVSARARVGQFVIPFGLLAVYSTPLQPVQSLYEKALGLRVDTGVMLEGRYGDFRYAGSVTAGTGPNQFEIDRSTLLAFRLSRSVVLPKIGLTEIGGSLLSGDLPETNFDTLLPPSGTTDLRTGVKSTRFAADAQLFRDPWTVRGELVFGGSEQEPVYGYFVEGDYRFTKSVSAVAYSRRWDFPGKPSRATSIGFGAQYTPPIGRNEQSYLTIRALFEFERNVPMTGQGGAQVYRRLTLQTYLSY
ncbi:MAG: hypothetical protein H7Y38_04360 [Armatimonadetes bacterium]|nr:hypothetical protein [Armatimonadota bacterium]